MARISSQEAAKKIGNRYDMVLIAAARARELGKFANPRVDCDNGNPVTAIREIEAGVTDKDYLKHVGMTYKREIGR